MQEKVYYLGHKLIGANKKGRKSRCGAGEDSVGVAFPNFSKI